MNLDSIQIEITREIPGSLTDSVIKHAKYPHFLQQATDHFVETVIACASAGNIVNADELSVFGGIISVFCHSGGEAVVLNEFGEIVQLSTRKKSSRRFTRHGRMGVISIIREVIGRRTGNVASFADIARYVLSVNVASPDGDGDRHNSLQKTLERLDDGKFVSIRDIELVADGLCIDRDILCFPMSFTTKAARRERADKIARRKDALRRQSVQLRQLDAQWPEVTDWTAKRWKNVQLRRATSPDKLSKQAYRVLRAKLNELIDALPRSKAKRRVQWQAIIGSLVGHSAAVWYGHYNDVVPLHGNSLYVKHSMMFARGEEICRDVIVIAAKDILPRLEVDLSHTVRLRPTTTEVAREFR